MKKLLCLIASMAIMAMFVAPVHAKGGFDEFGYNYQAMLFNGKADGVDRVSDEAVWGDLLYANDHLVMKWSKAWDDARFHNARWTCDAWENNEWNGAVKGGSGEVWHYKIVWVGGFNVEGTWKLNFNYDGVYPHTMVIDSFNPEDGVFSGTGTYDVDPLNYTWTVTGKVSGNNIEFDIIYTGANFGYTVHAEGTIADDGVLLSGNWGNASQNGLWSGTGNANGSCWRDGGYRIWGEFETIMDHGTADGEHSWNAHAIPTGYGGF